jgi:hypothetical protein
MINRLKFRAENERAAFIALVRGRLLHIGESLSDARPVVTSHREATSSGVQYRCAHFSMHVYETLR